MPEFYDVVDEQDRVVGKAGRQECHERRLIHRTVQILLFLPDGRLVVQKRSQAVDTFPGRLTASAAGHVDSGETYEAAAQRELTEELGVSVPLQNLGLVRSYDPSHLQHVMVFRGKIAKEPASESEEVAQLVFLARDELHRIAREQPDRLSPAFLEVVRFLETKKL